MDSVYISVINAESRTNARCGGMAHMKHGAFVKKQYIAAGVAEMSKQKPLYDTVFKQRGVKCAEENQEGS